MKKRIVLLVAVLIIGCSKVTTVENSNSNIFIGNWTQIENTYKGPPEHVSTILYADWEINIVTQSKWKQCNKFGADSTVIINWQYWIRNDSLYRSLDNSEYYVGKITKINDTIIIDEPVVKFKYARYNSDSLPSNWSKNIITKP
jgi:hypothetical protein